MAKLKLGIGAIMIAGVAAFLFFQHQAQVRLHDENTSLRERLDQLNQLSAENERLSNLVAQANSSLSNEQLRELLRLRSEVGSLRRQTNELSRLRDENRGLQATVAASRNLQVTNSPPGAAPHEFPKESWAFAGYATPEATLQSAAWSINKGDLKTVLANFTPDVQKQIEKRFEGKSENELGAYAEGVSREFSNITGYRILGKEVLSDDEAVLRFAALTVDNADNAIIKLKMQKIGNEWKIGEPVEH